MKRISFLVVAGLLLFSASLARGAAIPALKEHLKEKQVTEEAARTIFRHLAERKDEDPFERLLLWSRVGFFGLQNTYGHWTVEVGALQLGVFHAFDHLLATMLPAQREAEFFRLLENIPPRPLESLRRSLEMNALAYATPGAVKQRATAGFNALQADERCTAFRLAGLVAATDTAWLQQIGKLAEKEPDERVRLALIDSASMHLRPSREVALFELRLLENDSSLFVIDFVAERLRHSIMQGALRLGDRWLLVSALLARGDHSWRLVQIGRALVTHSCPPEYAVNENVRDDVFREFQQFYAQRRGGADVENEGLRLWEEWWQKNQARLAAKQLLKLSE